MRFQIFFSGTLMLILGGIAKQLLERNDALAFLQGALTLGGGVIICGLFSLKMKWHGIIGAGVLALLGAARGLANIPDFVKFGVTVICLVLLLRVIAALQRERTRRMLQEE